MDNEPEVKAYSVRTLSFGTITSPVNIQTVTIAGIDPELERNVSKVDNVIVEGEYFAGDNSRDIVIGQKLAEILEVTLGDRIVLTTAEAESGDLAQEMFRISGIFHMNVGEIDRGIVFIRLPQAQKMTNIGDNAHEIALAFHKTDIGRTAEHPFWKKYAVEGNEAVSWTVLMPSLQAVLNLWCSVW